MPQGGHVFPEIKLGLRLPGVVGLDKEKRLAAFSGLNFLLLRNESKEKRKL